MSSAVNHYRVLGVSPDSEDVVIQAAYEALLRRYEAAEQNDETAKRLQAIKMAHAFLSDPVIRRNYDASRAKSGFVLEESNHDTVEPAAAPEPEVPEAKAMSYHSIGSPPERGSNVWAWGFGIFALIVIINMTNCDGTANNGGNVMNVDEVLTSDAIMDNAVDNALDAAGNEVEAASALGDLPAPALQFGDIESAAKRFASILMNTGMTGAREYSVDCHKKVAQSPSWSAADHCAAFDYAAASVDRELSRQGTWAVDSYFQFHAANQEENYVSAGASKYSVTARLASIKSGAESAVTEAMRVAVAKSEAEQPASEKPAAPASEPEVDDPLARSNTIETYGE